MEASVPWSAAQSLQQIFWGLVWKEKQLCCSGSNVLWVILGWNSGHEQAPTENKQQTDVSAHGTSVSSSKPSKTAAGRCQGHSRDCGHRFRPPRATSPWPRVLCIPGDAGTTNPRGKRLKTVAEEMRAGQGTHRRAVTVPGQSDSGDTSLPPLLCPAPTTQCSHSDFITESKRKQNCGVKTKEWCRCDSRELLP